MFVDKPEQRQTPAFMKHVIRNVADLRWTFYRGYGEMRRWGGSVSVMGNMDFCRLDKLISSVWEEQGKDLLRAKKRRRRGKGGGTVAV